MSAFGFDGCDRSAIEAVPWYWPPGWRKIADRKDSSPEVTTVGRDGRSTPAGMPGDTMIPGAPFGPPTRKSTFVYATSSIGASRVPTSGGSPAATERSFGLLRLQVEPVSRSYVTARHFTAVQSRRVWIVRTWASSVTQAPLTVTVDPKPGPPIRVPGPPAGNSRASVLPRSYSCWLTPVHAPASGADDALRVRSSAPTMATPMNRPPARR